MLELPVKKVLAYRKEEVDKFRPDDAVPGVNYLFTHVSKEYPDLYVYQTFYSAQEDKIYVLLTDGPVPILSTVERNVETGEVYIKEELWV